MKRRNSRAILLARRALNKNVLARVSLHRKRLVDPRRRASSEAQLRSPIIQRGDWWGLCEHRDHTSCLAIPFSNLRFSWGQYC